MSSKVQDDEKATTSTARKQALYERRLGELSSPIRRIVFAARIASVDPHDVWEDIEESVQSAFDE